jgi:hypothetical protein
MENIEELSTTDNVKAKIKFKSSRSLYKTPKIIKDRNNKVVNTDKKKDVLEKNHSKISKS